MDPLTHGLTGALIGKAFLAERSPSGASPGGRLATLATTLGAIFPDGDVVAEVIPGNDLAIIEVHRSVTHSIVCLPAFAALLAAVTCWVAQRRGRARPSWRALAAAYAIGIASHILLDVITSFGTMIWSPLANTRVAWDLVFIIDFSMTGIVLLPQALAWAYSERDGGISRGALAWGLSTGGALLSAWLAHAAGFPYSPWGVAAAPLALLVLFALPAWRGWGFGLRRSSWCRAGVFALAAYLSLCVIAHGMALERVQRFAGSRDLQVEHLGALPMPPSVAHWEGLIRTSEGVYEARFDLLNERASESSAEFRFVADTAPHHAIEAARHIPEVRKYLWFARFPVFRFAERGGYAVLEISDLRFFSRQRRPMPFTFRVTLDSQRRVVEHGWAED